MQQFLNVTLSGITTGAVYAAFALALVLIWRSTRIVNVAQGAMAMFTTDLALAVIDGGGGYWLGLGVALGAGLVLGAAVERLVIRQVRGGSDLNAVIVTLGLFVGLQALAAVLFGSEFRSFPAPFDLRGFTVGEVNVALTPNSIYVVGAVVVTVAALVALFRFTDLGLRMRAAAFAPEVARLLGVRVGALLTLGWALAAVVGSLAGVLIAGGGLVFPAYMDSVIVYGFVAAVLGGLESPAGAVVGGLSIGLVLSWVSGFVPGGGALVPTTALLILVVVLLVRPHGLFAGAAARRV